MSGHTPQQWIAVGTMVEVAEDEVPDICSCSPVLFGQDHERLRRRDYIEQCANARLIAQAPRLHEAAKLLVGSYTPENGTYALGELHRARTLAGIIIEELGGE